MDDMKNFGSHELKALDGINSSGLRMIRMIFGCQPKALDAMNNSGLCMT